MRLSAAERQAVERASREALPSGTRVLLFGSRLDDERRGGDIDLLVELPESLSADDAVNRRARFTARLYRLFEERRIDVVMTQQGQPDPRAVVAAARRQGIELARTWALAKSCPLRCGKPTATPLRCPMRWPSGLPSRLSTWRNLSVIACS